MHKNYLLTLILSFLFVSCVTVDLIPQPGQSFKDVTFKTPPEAFENTDNDDLDKLWIHKNGASISFLSNCHPSDDPSLESIQKSIVSSIEDTQVLASKPFRYNSRSALRTSIQGNVDGIASKFDLVIFKKHNCIFVLTYTSLPNIYSKNLRDFEDFIRNFRVP